ncbi:MAG: ATP-binding cassette domain-containing protein [Gammaproteobacteria bacterium]|nr:ATP-binding cassette domain-containing protein [Gammaproteobacteria bacterium]
MSDIDRDGKPNAGFGQLRSGLVRGMVVVGVFSAICNLLMLTTPIYMLQMFDRVLSSRNLDTLILLTVIAAFALLTLAALMIVRSSVLIRIGVWFDQQVGGAALASVIASATKSGKAPSSRVMGDLASIRSFFGKTTIIPLFDAPWSPIFLLIIFLLSPILGGVALTGLIVMLALAIAHDRVIAYLSTRASAVTRPAKDQAKSLLRHADTAVSMGMVSTLVRGWRNQNGDASDSQAAKQQAQAAYTALTLLVTQGMRVAMLCAGAVLVIQNSITTGVMLASAILATRLLAPMTGLVKAWRSVTTAREAYSRLKKDLELTPVGTFGDQLYISDGGLSVERIGFRYSKSSPTLLRNLSLDLEPGEVLCVVGPPGSGKSTLAKLLVGILRPRSGRVLLGGNPVIGLAADVRASHIGYLPPDLQFFDGTIHENISRMRPGVREFVVEAAKLAGVHDAIINLPDGYDTKIVNGQSPLSPGEMQLLSIARAVFGKPRLVVLDDPTAKLDRSSERILANVVQALKSSGAIMVIIAHRTSILRQSDRILALPQGKTSRPGDRQKVDLTVIEDGRDRPTGDSSRRENG